MMKMEPTVVESLSEHAGVFAEKYLHNKNFIQRYRVWTNTIDRYSKGAATGYDMGCGSGIFSFYMASKGIQTVGFDGAKGMIELCNSSREEKKISNIEFRLEMLPLWDYVSMQPVDLIITSSVLEYIENIDSTLKMFDHLLKPNGKLIVSFPNKDAVYRKIEMGIFRMVRKPDYFRFVKNIWNKKEAKELFGRHGFHLVESFYYSDRSLISRIAGIAGGGKRAGNMTMMVFDKQK